MSGLFFVLILTAAVLSFGYSIVRWSLQRRKGSLTVALAPTPPMFAQPVNGVLSIRSDRHLGPGRVTVELVMTERDHDSTHVRTLYRDTIELVPAAEVGPAQPFSVPFTLGVPPAGHHRVLNGYDFDSWTRWAVRGRYEVDGVDLEGSAPLKLPNPRALGPW